jgi:hypothetical protein
MRHALRRLTLSGFLVAASGATLPPSPVGAQDAPESPFSRPVAAKVKKTAGLRIVDPVVCTSIEGYEEYEKHPDAKLTCDEKLLVYYRPKGYKVVHLGDVYIARFVQDGQIRRLGDKRVLLRKEKLLNYEAKSDVPPDEIYFRNTFSLKGLPPGDYEYDVILRDVAARPAVITTVESVKFQVVPAKYPEAGPGAEPNAGR